MASKVLHSLPPIAPVSPAPRRPAHTPHPSLTGRTGLAKRTIDIIGSLVGLFFLAPVFLLVAIAIKLDSPGPVIFRQQRVGLDGREFELLKFRSMYLNAEARKAELMAFNEIKDGPIFKMKRDPRVTRVGRFIRRTSLDEFPQLLNILRGDMSLVGPRPPLPSEVAHYSSSHWERLSVIPGATGLWQVSGRSDLDSFNSMVALDMAYIRTWSLLKDLEIIFKTFQVIFRMEGAC